VTTVPSDPQNTLREGIIELTVCPWKGQASYFDLEVEGQVNRGAAWYYPTPKEAAGTSRTTSRSGKAWRSPTDARAAGSSGRRPAPLAQLRSSLSAPRAVQAAQGFAAAAGMV